MRGPILQMLLGCTLVICHGCMESGLEPVPEKPLSEYCDDVMGSCLALKIEATAPSSRLPDLNQYALLRVRASTDLGSAPMYTADGNTPARLPVLLKLTPPMEVDTSQIKRIEIDGLDMTGEVVRAARISVDWPKGEHIAATTKLGVESLFGPPITSSEFGQITTYTSYAPGKFNDDDKLDLVMSVDKNVKVLFGDGAGGFSSGPISSKDFPMPVTVLAAADFNHDGKYVVAAGLSQSTDLAVSFVKRGASVTFSAPERIQMDGSVAAISIGDLNRDGFPDLAVVAGNALKILIWDGMRFKPQTSIPMRLRPKLGDIDGDGIQDVVAWSDTIPGKHEIYLLKGDVTGTLKPAQTFDLGEKNIPSDLALADMDGDGDLDAVVIVDLGLDQGFHILVMKNDGMGVFTGGSVSEISSRIAPTRIFVGDLDADGRLDLITHYGTSPMWFLLNQGDGHFVQLDFDPIVGPFTVADFTNDGKLDIIAGAAVAGPFGLYPNIAR